MLPVNSSDHVSRIKLQAYKGNFQSISISIARIGGNILRGPELFALYLLANVVSDSENLENLFSRNRWLTVRYKSAIFNIYF